MCVGRGHSPGCTGRAGARGARAAVLGSVAAAATGAAGVKGGWVSDLPSCEGCRCAHYYETKAGGSTACANGRGPAPAPGARRANSAGCCGAWWGGARGVGGLTRRGRAAPARTRSPTPRAATAGCSPPRSPLAPQSRPAGGWRVEGWVGREGCGCARRARAGWTPPRRPRLAALQRAAPTAAAAPPRPPAALTSRKASGRSAADCIWHSSPLVVLKGTQLRQRGSWVRVAVG